MNLRSFAPATLFAIAASFLVSSAQAQNASPLHANRPYECLENGEIVLYQQGLPFYRALGVNYGQVAVIGVHQDSVSITAYAETFYRRITLRTGEVDVVATDAIKRLQTTTILQNESVSTYAQAYDVKKGPYGDYLPADPSRPDFVKQLSSMALEAIDRFCGHKYSA